MNPVAFLQLFQRQSHDPALTRYLQVEVDITPHLSQPSTVLLNHPPRMGSRSDASTEGKVIKRKSFSIKIQNAAQITWLNSSWMYI